MGAGFVSGFIFSEGDVKTAIISGITAGAFNIVGDFSLANGLLDGGIEKTLMHGMVGGLSTGLQGGNFVEGFVSAAAGEWFSPTIKGIPNGFGQLIVRAVIGGTAAEIGGGKFQIGAITAAFGYLFNQNLHSRRKLPSADTLYDNYPAANPDGTPAHPSADGYENQCAIRVTVSLEKSGFSIDTYPSLNKTSEGYARSLKGLADYLWKEVGPPLIVSPETFHTKYYSTFKGVAYFAPPPNGVGHIDVWNSSRTQPYGSGYHTSSEVWLFRSD